jgi:hypothetical protein
MQRLTWDGIALHAGALPGYPASHGCVRLPKAFAEQLFGATSMGMTVVVTDQATSPHKLDAGDLLAPVTTKGAEAAPKIGAPLTAHETYSWKPEAAPTGPVTLLVSSLDQRLVVMRNGQVIGRGVIKLPKTHLAGTHALAFTGFDADGHSQWLYVSIPGDTKKAGERPDLSGLHELRIDPDYLQKVRSVLAPGVTMLVTDGSILGGGAGKHMTVMDEAA